MKEQEEIFENRIKAMLEDAEEPVPDFVWDGVNAKLDAAEAPKGLWWWTSRVAAPVVAAAAAIAVGVFAVSGRLDSDGTDMIEVLREDEAFVTPVFAEVEESASEECVPVKPAEYVDVAEHAESAEIIEVAEKVDVPETVDTGEPEDCTVPEIKGKETKECGKETQKAGPATLTFEDWAEFEAPGKAGKRKLLLSFAGNITGRENNFSKDIRPMKTSSSLAPYTSGLKETGNSTYSLPVTIGIGAKYEFTRKWALGVGLNYTHLSRRLSGVFTDVSGEEVVRTTYKDIINNQSYIGLEAKLFFNAINSRILDFYVYAGGGVDKPFSNNFKMKGHEGIRLYKGECKGVQPYLKAGLGLEFNVSRFVGIYLDPNVAFCFRNDKLPQSIRTVHSIFPGVEVGLRFRL